MVIDNKRGWITVLEATIAVMLVSGVLMVVYVKQDTHDSSVQDYVFSLQRQILADISARSDLRTLALKENETELNIFVGSKIPTAYRSSLKVCRLESNDDFCKLNYTEVIEAREKEVFVEETVISSELVTGASAIYEPMKVRIFVWENR